MREKHVLGQTCYGLDNQKWPEENVIALLKDVFMGLPHYILNFSALTVW